MADQRDAARERARDILQQRAAAAAARAAASAAPAVAAVEPAPAPEPGPEAQTEQPAPVLESPPPLPVPDLPAEDNEGSDTITATAESDEDGDPGSDTITLTNDGDEEADQGSDTITGSADVGYAVDLKFPPSQPDGTGSAPLDSEQPVPEEPEREEPLPPPAVLPTPAEQPPATTGAEELTSPAIDPTAPPQAADAGPVLPGFGRPAFAREVGLDPMRERLEAAAKDIQLPGHSGAGLASEVTQGAEVLSETGVAQGIRQEGDDQSSGSQAGTANLDIFVSRFATKRSGGPDLESHAARPEPDAGSRDNEDQQPFSLPAAPSASPGSPVVAANALPPGFQAMERLADTGRAVGLPGHVPPEPELAAPTPRDTFEPELDAWALHRTRLSLIDSPSYDHQEAFAPPQETPDPMELPPNDE